jgi:hypothetical protein
MAGCRLRRCQAGDGHDAEKIGWWTVTANSKVPVVCSACMTALHMSVIARYHCAVRLALSAEHAPFTSKSTVTVHLAPNLAPFDLKPPMARRYHYHVYVIELSKDVLYEPRFKKANPDYVSGKPCVYVGMTGLNPDLRFDKHKAGIQANKFAQKFGLRLLPALYEIYNPMPYEGAREMEVELAIGLREAGYGVWQA